MTAGGHGIGHATAAALVQRGARVAVGDADYDRARHTASTVNHAHTPDGGGLAIALGLDAGDPESFRRFLEETRHDFGPIDALITLGPGGARADVEHVLQVVIARREPPVHPDQAADAVVGALRSRAETVHVPPVLGHGPAGTERP